MRMMNFFFVFLAIKPEYLHASNGCTIFDELVVDESFRLENCLNTFMKFDYDKCNGKLESPYPNILYLLDFLNRCEKNIDVAIRFREEENYLNKSHIELFRQYSSNIEQFKERIIFFSEKRNFEMKLTVNGG